MNNNRISRGKKRTVIKCHANNQDACDIPYALTNREYSNVKNEIYPSQTDSLITICQSNDLSEPESIKLLNKGKKKNLTEDEINNVLESCGQDQKKMLNLCKDLLKNSSNPDLKAVISKHLQGKEKDKGSDERVTDSIKRKAKELNGINWKVDKFSNNNNYNI